MQGLILVYMQMLAANQANSQQDDNTLWVTIIRKFCVFSEQNATTGSSARLSFQLRKKYI